MRYIYIIKTTQSAGWDEYKGHVVIAKNPKEARSLCPYGTEGQNTWLYKKYSTIQNIGTTHLKSQVVLSSFHAG